MDGGNRKCIYEHSVVRIYPIQTESADQLTQFLLEKRFIIPSLEEVKRVKNVYFLLAYYNTR